MSGRIFQFFAGDHRRLDALLGASTRTPGRVDMQPFTAFRVGLLTHIGMEEKLLFPALHAARPDQALPIAAKLRVDHGALAALLVPTPTPSIIDRIRSILAPHNRREEETGGVYDLCDSALGAAGAEDLLHQAQAFPEVPVNPLNDSPGVMNHVAVTVDLARRQWLDRDVPD